MTRLLTILNAAGVFALAVLCVIQWQRDRNAHRELYALQQTNNAQSTLLLEQSNAMRGVTEDLVEMKDRFSRAHSDLTDARTALQKSDRENSQLLSERDQLKASVTNWAAAVAERDERLKEVTARAQELAGKLNDSITRFNDLATNYNASVVRFNELATNYNNVVDQLNAARRAQNTNTMGAALK